MSVSHETFVAGFRRQFAQMRGKLYFDFGAAAIMPSSVVRACCDGVRVGADLAISPAVREHWSVVRDETRQKAARLIGAAAANVAFVSSTSAALSLISQAIPWRRGDNVIAATVDNPATVVPWQNMEHLGVSMRYLPAGPDDLIDLSALPRLITSRTRLIALSLVQYSTGQRLDIRRVVKLCRQRGILVSVDAVQAIGSVPVDVKKLGVNFLSFGAQKWLMGPRHVALLYADKTALDLSRSPVVTESSVADIAAEEELTSTGRPPQLHVKKDGRKFEVVPYHNFAGIFGLHQSLVNFETAGADFIYRRQREVTDELVDRLGRLSGRVISPRDDTGWSGLVSFAPVGKVAVAELAARLRSRGIFVALRKGRLRMSPPWFTTSVDMRRFVAALTDAGA